MISAPAVSMLANHLWQSTVVAVCIGLLTLALRHNSARLRHLLWMIASAKFLVPFSLLITLGAHIPRLSAPAAARPEVSHVLEQITVPFSQPQITSNAAESNTNFSSRSIPAAASNASRWHAVLAAVWVVGFLAVLFSWMRKWAIIHKAARRAECIGAIENVRILSSESLIEPGVFGIFKPVVLLPASIRDRLSGQELKAVLAHELFHVRSRDNLSAAIHMLVQAVFWFYPLSWYIGRRLVEERELACDEAVVQAGNEPEAYAQGILNVCKAYVESRLACVPGVTGADLKKRLVRIASNQMARKLDGRRKLLLAAVAFFTLATPIAFGVFHAAPVYAQTASTNSPQDLAGIWQGTLHGPGGHDLRIVYKITKTANGWSGQAYSIDQTPAPIPITTITLQRTDVKMTVQRIGGTYEGKMSPDGSTITGDWNQGATTPLVMKRVLPDAAWAIPEAPPRPKPMAADANPDFEVATIKPSKPDQPGKAFLVRGRRFSTINTTLGELLAFGYHMNSRQLIGLPSWAGSQKYDIEAQPDGEGEPSDAQWRLMLRKLLDERFKLTYHKDQKELPVYALTVAKGGPKMTPNHDDPNGLPGLFFRGLGDLNVSNADMSHFCELLEGAVLDKPVVDHTGLIGKYDFQLKWTPDPTQFAGFGAKMPPPATGPDAPPDLFAAVQQQLGLKLDNTKASVPVLVFDQAQQPTAN